MGIYMSTVTFRHEKNRTEIKNGVKHRKTESVIDGSKGLSLYFLNKTAKDSDFYKLSIKSSDKQIFSVMEKKGDKETTTDIKKADLMKMLKKNKDLDFMVKFMEKGPSALKGYKKKAKKSSKKKSKKSKKKSKKSKKSRKKRKKKKK